MEEYTELTLKVRQPRDDRQPQVLGLAIGRQPRSSTPVVYPSEDAHPGSSAPVVNPAWLLQSSTPLHRRSSIVTGVWSIKKGEPVPRWYSFYEPMACEQRGDLVSLLTNQMDETDQKSSMAKLWMLEFIEVWNTDVESGYSEPQVEKQSKWFPGGT